MATTGTERPLSAVVLAAGGATRMLSSRPEALHQLCGRPMVLHVIDALAELAAGRVVVVVGDGADVMSKTVQEETGENVSFVEHGVERGSGDAVSVALTVFPEVAPDEEEAGDLLIVPGEAPLVRPATLGRLVQTHRAADAAATVLTARVAEPRGHPRVVRDKDGEVSCIVLAADVSEDERAIDEVATPIYCFRRGVLAPALRRLTPDSADGEYYLSDTIEVLHDAGYPVASVVVADPMEATGVYDRVQLAVAETELRRRINERWMRAGVTMADPARTYVDASVQLAEDVTLHPGTMLQGWTVVGRGCEIGPDTRLVDCGVGEGATVETTTARQAHVGARAWVGPYAVLEAGARVADGTVTGPFFQGRIDGRVDEPTDGDEG